MSDEEEVWLSPGETWFRDANALAERLGADYLTLTEDGDLYAGISGKGELPVADLLKAEGKPKAASSSVVPIK